jgi:hypothetical protein
MTVSAERQIPGSADRIVTRYLELVDETLPGRIEALYLVGSVALDDYRDGCSDVDFVALVGSPLSSGEMDRMEVVHRGLLTEGGRPWLDGLYLTWSDLAQSPDEVQIAPHSLEGQFRRSRSFEANPVTWRTLRNHPLTVRGPVPSVWHDPDFLKTWTLHNLNSYWADVAEQLERAVFRLTEPAISEAIPWCVSGVARLAYTRATGEVTSKTGACRYALTVYPDRWHSIILQALAIRGGTRPEADPPKPIEDTIAFMRHVIQVENDRPYA